MRRLVIFQKAKARVGLVAVRRQVNKKGGKPFMQTFYVKPEQAAVEPKKKLINTTADLTPLTPGNDHYNRPDGFYIGVTTGADGEKMARVPDAAILGTIKRKGHIFVAHLSIDIVNKAWGPGVNLTEITSGFRGAYGNNPTDAIDSLDRLMADRSEERVASIVNSVGKISTREDVILDVSNWPLTKYITEDEKSGILNQARQQDNARHLTEDEVQKWAYRVLDDKKSWAIFKEKIFTMENFGKIFAMAVKGDLSLSGAQERFEWVNDVLSHRTLPYLKEELLDWIIKHDVPKEPSYYDEERVTFEEVLERAIEKDWDLTDALDVLNQERESIVETTKVKPKTDDRYDYQDLSNTDIVKGLNDGNVIDKAILKGGCNKSIWVDMKDTPDTQAVFKPQEGEAAYLRDNVPSNFYVREAIAYELDQLLGFYLVPPTIIKEIEGYVGSVQMFAGDARHHVPMADISEVERRRAGIMDFLMYNTDRHDGNYMVDSNDHLILIDNGLTFPNTNVGLRTESYSCADLKLTDDEISRFNSVDWLSFMDRMVAEGIDSESVDLFCQRLFYVMYNGSTPTEVRGNNLPWSTIPKYTELKSKVGGSK